MDALAVLSVLARAQNKGGPVRLSQIGNQVRLMPHRCEAALERAARLGWTARTEKDSWVLARDADTIRVIDIFRKFAFDAETWSFDMGGAGAHAAGVRNEREEGMISIPRSERLIVALDVPTAKEARALAEKLGDAVRFYKIGLELFTAEGYFELLSWLTARGNKVFADLKLYDIPETVRRAVANLRGRGATFLTVHGHRSVMEAAAREKGAMKILAVTVLTSFDQRDLSEMGSTLSVEQLVLARAKGAVRMRLRRRDRLGARGAGAKA